jgi:hypothetical protein
VGPRDFRIQRWNEEDGDWETVEEPLELGIFYTVHLDVDSNEYLQKLTLRDLQ